MSLRLEQTATVSSYWTAFFLKHFNWLVKYYSTLLFSDKVILSTNERSVRVQKTPEAGIELFNMGNTNSFIRKHSELEK